MLSLETLWDEHVDQRIAAGLLAHPLLGEQPTLDGSQTRLPMYLTAIGYALTGCTDLFPARGVSLLCAATTVFITGILARRLFGNAAGMVAAVLLAFSPYFLAYGRIAMTEGDIYFACFMTLATLAYWHYHEAPTISRWLAIAVLSALAVGAKLYAIVPLGALALATRPSPFGRQQGPFPCAIRVFRWLLAIGGFVLLYGMIVAGLAFASQRDGAEAASHEYQTAAIVAWGALLAVTIVAGIILGFASKIPASPFPKQLPLFDLLSFSFLLFFALMPVHLTAHGIFREIVRGLVHWNKEVPLALADDHLRLYSGILLLKLTWPFGLLTVAAIFFAVRQARRNTSWRVCLLPIILYILALCFLPLRQSFYLMGIYPLIIILLAGFIVHVARALQRRGRHWRMAWVVLMAACLGYLAIEVYRTFPNYQLYGYAMIGERWLGRESRGYRNLIQTPSDGVESLIRWCNHNAAVQPGSRVVSYLWESSIINDILPSQLHYAFVPRGTTENNDLLPPPPSIDDADFVLVHINNRLGYGDRPPDWPPEPQLSKQFSIIHTVRRGPLEIAWVYGRREPIRELRNSR